MKQLNRWQARWAEFLSKFNFKIMYRPGKQEKKPDVLTQRSQNILKKVEDSQQQYQFQLLLQDNQLNKDIIKALTVIFCAGNTKKKVNIDKNIINAEDYLNNNTTKDNNLATDWESADIKSWNHEKNIEVSMEKLFENMYKNNELV